MTGESSSVRRYNSGAGRPAKAAKPRPKIKSIQDRIYKVKKPVRRKEESHPRARRLAVVMFLYHHRIFDPDHHKAIKGYRRPTQKEAAAYFQVKQQTISDWYRHDIISIKQEKRAYSPVWPQLEKQLFEDFIQLRLQQRAVSTAWFRKRAKDIFTSSVSSEEQAVLFTFSNGCNYHPKLDIESILDTPRRRFKQRYTLNVDETPIAFEINSGDTWDLQGSNTISVKTVRSGWEKRQATAILYIFGDGVCRLEPTIIFKGSPSDKSRIFKDEGSQYALGIRVIYNEHAYNNEDLMESWLKEDIPTVKSATEDFLLVMDAASFHLTDRIKVEVRRQLLTSALIPAGCTSLLQPLDTTIHRLFKQFYREEMDIYELEEERKGKTYWTISERRIMTTWIVHRAWERIKKERDIIRDSFLRAGITTRPDGSQDHLISIKGIENIDCSGWEKAGDTSIKSEELVDRLCDEEELSFGPDEEYGEDTLIFTLRRLKVSQLRQMASLNNISSLGKKSDLIERLRSHLTTIEKVGDSITVQIEDPDVVFAVEDSHS
ncbi:Peroxisomal targeting signal 2 receptor [Fusarium oxysporum f. sp. albedinis]|nr:Peroxisomal targeting signal 2 receptor [Fusarium oxysporum f. sp. albedinis]